MPETKPCSWDTFRTFYPLMALHSPVQFAQIVDNYIDGYLKQGWMPECRANNLPGWTQGGVSLSQDDAGLCGLTAALPKAPAAT